MTWWRLPRRPTRSPAPTASGTKMAYPLTSSAYRKCLARLRPLVSDTGTGCNFRKEAVVVEKETCVFIVNTSRFAGYLLHRIFLLPDSCYTDFLFCRKYWQYNKIGWRINWFWDLSTQPMVRNDNCEMVLNPEWPEYSPICSEPVFVITTWTSYKQIKQIIGKE